MSPVTRVCIVGAGAAGLGLAALCRMAEAFVVVHNRPGARFSALAQHGCLAVELESHAARRISGIVFEASPAAAVRGADIVMIAVNSDAQSAVIAELAAWLEPHVSLVLVPGHTGGASLAAGVLARIRPELSISIVEFQALPFVARLVEDGAISLRQRKRMSFIATSGRELRPEVLSWMRAAFGEVRRRASTLWTGMHNMTIVVQPVIALSNLARISSGESFRFYEDGVTDSVSRVMECIDQERMSVATALGLNDLMTAKDWHEQVYGVCGEALGAVIRAVPGYAGVLAPTTVHHRFLTEHVKCGLVPLEAYARKAGVSVPLCRSVIELASSATGQDLRSQGRNAAALGLGS